jgi:hypothetical protein
MKIRYLTGGMTGLTYTCLPMTEIAAQTAYNANPTYDADIKKPPKFGRF